MNCLDVTDDSIDDNFYCDFCENNPVPNTNMCYSCTEAYENYNEQMLHELCEGTLDDMIFMAIEFEIAEMTID
jgi:hypothetical protein